MSDIAFQVWPADGDMDAYDLIPAGDGPSAAISYARWWGQNPCNLMVMDHDPNSDRFFFAAYRVEKFPNGEWSCRTYDDFYGQLNDNERQDLDREMKAVRKVYDEVRD